MDGPLIDGEGSLAHRLRKRWMRMAGAGEILRRTAKFHQNHGFSDQFSSACAQDMDAQHLVARRVGQNFPTR